MEKEKHYEEMKVERDFIRISSEHFPVDYHLHWHKYAEVILMTEKTQGMMKPIITVNKTEQIMESGDILFIWPGELHEISDNVDRGLMGFQFPVTLFTENPDFAVYLNLFRTYRHISAEQNPDLAQSIASYIRHIFEINSKKSLFPSVEMLISFYEMFMTLGGHIRRQVSPGADKTLEKIDVACRFIQENCEKDLPLEMVANYINFSSCYFSRLFKQTTQYSFVDYLNLQRVKRAQSLLVDSELNMTEVSFQAGFKSISTFNRVFRQCRGCSPSEYRKYYIEEAR